MAGEFWLSEAQWEPMGRCCPRTSLGREGPTTGGSSASPEYRPTRTSIPCRKARSLGGLLLNQNSEDA
jgi:hypothetical protein